MFGRPFTQDGHMVGSIGEAFPAHHYGLVLTPPSTQGCDAHTAHGRRIEIKATEGLRVAFRCKAGTSHCLANQPGRFDEGYNGLGTASAP